MPSLWAIEFISRKNIPAKAPCLFSIVELIDSQFEEHPCWIRQPPTSAMRKAASLPLGSIIPQSKSYRVYSQLVCSSAVVPSIEQAMVDALILMSLAEIEFFSKSYRIVTRFIILVKLAISLRFRPRLAQRDRPCLISQSTQLLAVTLGGMSEKLLCQSEVVFLVFLTEPETSRTRMDLQDSYDFFEVGRLRLADLSQSCKGSGISSAEVQAASVFLKKSPLKIRGAC